MEANDTNYRKKLTQREGIISIVGNMLLFFLKLWAGMVTGSIALVADAWHTLTDSVSSAIVLFSAWASSKPADEDHPFGHGRMDLVCSVIIGVILAMIGFDFIVDASAQLRSGTGVDFGVLAVSVTILAIIGKELMAQYAFWAYRKTGNPVLKADGWHHRTDSLSSVIVLVGIGFSQLFWWIDGALGIIVALMIFYASYEILRDSIDRLIGEKPDKHLLAEICEIIAENDPNLEPHHFHLHRYGDHLELTFHISMSPELTLHEAHDITNSIENEIRDKFSIEATIHMEPYESNRFEK
ncbi:MAG: cation transporter [Desulfobulbaceae bacterium]|nr:MAG: cation transporter [Desulfobulbaceae bacterium]